MNDEIHNPQNTDSDGTEGAERILSLPMFNNAPTDGDDTAPAGGAAHLLNRIETDRATRPRASRRRQQTLTPPRSVGPQRPVRETAADEEIDWALVATFRSRVSQLLVKQLEDRLLPREQQEAIGRRIVAETLKEHADSLVRQGAVRWSEDFIERIHTAIFDSLFRLGRIQPLLEIEGVENVMIHGCDNVFLDYGGGDIRPAGPVADSDEELIEQLTFIASREGERGRPFSPVAWELRMTLPGGERLQATHPPITPRPHVVIRRHPLIATTLEDLVALGTLTKKAADFLQAAILARKSIVVSGQQGTGKTTLLRALAHVMDPYEHIVTIESERELHLDRSGKHHLVTPFEARPGQGEVNADGSQAGEVSQDELIVASLRHNTQRIIVGEIRGPEVGVMMQAMQAGAGTMSTIHTNTPTETIERLAVLLGYSAINANDAFAYRLVGQHVDFIVQLSNTNGAGHRIGTRFISEISEVVPGEGIRPICQEIFKAETNSTTAELVGRPQDRTLNDMASAGLKVSQYYPGAAS